MTIGDQGNNLPSFISDFIAHSTPEQRQQLQQRLQAMEAQDAALDPNPSVSSLSITHPSQQVVQNENATDKFQLKEEVSGKMDVAGQGGNGQLRPTMPFAPWTHSQQQLQLLQQQQQLQALRMGLGLMHPSATSCPHNAALAAQMNISFSPFCDQMPLPIVRSDAAPAITCQHATVDLRTLNGHLARVCLKIDGKVQSLPLANEMGGVTPMTQNEDGKRLDFAITWYMFVVANSETEEKYMWFRESLLVTLEYHLALNLVNVLRALPLGMPVPPYLHLPENPRGKKYTTEPGPCPFGRTFEQRFEEYVERGFNNILNRVTKGVEVESPARFDPQCDEGEYMVEKNTNAPMLSPVEDSEEETARQKEESTDSLVSGEENAVLSRMNEEGRE